MVRFFRILTLTLLFSAGSCSLWFAPVMQDGRSAAPAREILVIHGLAETISSVELGASGSFLRVDHDVTVLGSVPSAIVRAGQELVVTLSGENSLLVLDRDLLVPKNVVRMDQGINPMQTRVLSGSAQIYGTTGFLSGRLHLYHRDGTVVDTGEADLSAGAAPQALLVIPGVGDDPATARVLVADTGYNATPLISGPFGKAQLTVFDVTIGTAGATVTGRQQITLADEVVNPVALLDAALVDPAVQEVLVIASGVNYGSDGTGENDGTVLVLDRDTLAVKQEILYGGSPGGGLILERADGGLTLFTSGVEGISSLQRPLGATGWAAAAVPEYAAAAGGGLPLLSGIAAWNDSLYVADFGNDRILRFVLEEDGAGGLSLAGSVPVQAITVSDGPQALLVQIRE